MVTVTLLCPYCESDVWFVMGMHPMESKDPSVRKVSGIVERIHLLVDILKNARKKY